MVVERRTPGRRDVRKTGAASAELLDHLVLGALFFDDDGAAEDVTSETTAKADKEPPPSRGERET